MALSVGQSALAFVFLLAAQFGANTAANPDRYTRQSNYYGVTNYEINESVKRVDKTVRVLDNKLSRHEYRESQVAADSVKLLTSIAAHQTAELKKTPNFEKKLKTLEERLVSIEALVLTTDERQRKKLDSLSDGLNRLLMTQPALGSVPTMPLLGPNPAVEQDIKEVLRKVKSIDEKSSKNAQLLNKEVLQVGVSLTQEIDDMKKRQENFWSGFKTCEKKQIDFINKVSKSLDKTSDLIVKQVDEAKKLVSERSDNDCNSLGSEVTDRLDSIDKAYHDQEKEIEEFNQQTHAALMDQKNDLHMLLKETKNENDLLHKYFGNVFENLKQLDLQSKQYLGNLEASLHNILNENSYDIQNRIESVASVLKKNTKSIMLALDDSASMSENLQISMSENFEDLTKNIKGLKKIEKVLISTADAVLNTRQTIEFGIRQIIIELTDIINDNGQNINSTLSDKINTVSFEILRNQTSALTNMTKRMETEISQVWRQIGIMYQQIAQSVNILGELQTTTSQQMNASLDKVGTMDGTVGAINNKVADVEDNLNYLLGRLSLVVSEFSQLKTGVGSELEKLRHMAQEFSEDKVVEYEVSTSQSKKKDEENDQ